MPFLRPNQQRQSTEGVITQLKQQVPTPAYCRVVCWIKFLRVTDSYRRRYHIRKFWWQSVEGFLAGGGVKFPPSPSLPLQHSRTTVQLLLYCHRLLVLTLGKLFTPLCSCCRPVWATIQPAGVVVSLYWPWASCSHRCAPVVGLSERLFNQLESSTKTERHEVKLMMTNLISRLVGIHQVHQYCPLVSYCEYMPSVLWCCWLGGRTGIQRVKKLSGGVPAWLSLWSEVQTLLLQ